MEFTKFFAIVSVATFLQCFYIDAQKDIVETAIANGNFKTLVAALTAADLVATLKGPGPFTVFAPTDAAFSKIPPATLADLLKSENKIKLAGILKYHVLNKRVTSADILAMQLPAKVEMIDGNTVTVSKDGTNVKVNDATVTIADVSATNGIIHVIDTVLMPPTSGSSKLFSVNQTFLIIFLATIVFFSRSFF